MSNKIYPLYEMHRRGLGSLCTEHDWQNSEAGAYPDRAVKWWEHACKKCYLLVRTDVLDWPLGTAQMPDAPPKDHVALEILVSERPHSRAFDE